MDIFLYEHKKLFKELLEGGVDFILIGGYAVNIHGYVRTTKDMDLWIKPDNDNKMRLLNVLSNKGFNKDDLIFIEKQDFEKAFVFHIGTPPLQVDFLTKINSVTYNDANEKKLLLPVEDFFVPVIQYHHLILSKISTGRLQDAADVERLQKINKSKK